MKRNEAEGILDVVTGTFSIHSYLVIVLFDFDASHFFLAPSIVDNRKLVISPRSPAVSVTTLTGDFGWCEKLFEDCPI